MKQRWTPPDNIHVMFSVMAAMVKTRINTQELGRGSAGIYAKFSMLLHNPCGQLPIRSAGMLSLTLAPLPKDLNRSKSHRPAVCDGRSLAWKGHCFLSGRTSVSADHSALLPLAVNLSLWSQPKVIRNSQALVLHSKNKHGSPSSMTRCRAGASRAPDIVTMSASCFPDRGTYYMRPLSLVKSPYHDAINGWSTRNGPEYAC